MAGALDLLALPLMTLLPPWSHSQQQLAWGRGEARQQGDALCCATLAFLHVAVGTLLPLLAAVWTWQPPPAVARASSSQPAARPSAAGTAPPLRAQRASEQLHKLRRRASSAAVSADVALARLLSGKRTPGGRAGVAWLLVAAAWLCCRTLALPL